MLPLFYHLFSFKAKSFDTACLTTTAIPITAAISNDFGQGLRNLLYG
jgi:hypothetical protein